MGIKAAIDAVYVLSEDIVSREIEDELIIVPLVSGIGDMEDDLFTLNGQKNLKDIVEQLSEEFEAFEGEIEKDVIGLVEELLKRRMVVEVK